MLADPQEWRRRLEHAAADPRTAPLRIAESVVAELGVDGAGVSLASSSGARAIVCATDERAQRIEDLQMTLGVGPCMDAITYGTAVLVPDVQQPTDLAVERWPGFLEAAEQAGVRALFALPLRVGAIRLGAFDLHRTRAGRMSPAAVGHAFMAADVIASALLDVDLPEASSGEQPWPGLATGMHVHQATGMVQQQMGVDTTSALLALRARAFSEGRPLADLAKDVVERRVRFAEEEDPR